MEEKTTWVSEKNKIGFRGSYFYKEKPKWPKLARMQVVVERPRGEILMFDIPMDCLPYIPDESVESDFQKQGKWHYFQGIMEIDVSLEKKLLGVRLDGKEIYNGYLSTL